MIRKFRTFLLLLLVAVNAVSQTKTDDLLQILDEGKYSCVIYTDGKLRTFNKSGVRDLYDLLTTNPSVLKDARMADKIIGKGAAALMILGGVKEVTTHVISESALRLLKDANVNVSYEKCIYGIINRKKSDWCPLEKRLTNATTAEECRPIITQFIADLDAGNMKLPEPDERQQWVISLYKIVYPVLNRMSEGSMLEDMSTEQHIVEQFGNVESYRMRCFETLVAGLSPWLALAPENTVEGQMRSELQELMVKSLANVVHSSNSHSIARGESIIISAAYTAQGFLRARNALWEQLDATTKRSYISDFKTLCKIEWNNEKLLPFEAVIQAFLMEVGAPVDTIYCQCIVERLHRMYAIDNQCNISERREADDISLCESYPMVLDALKIMSRHKIANRCADVENIEKKITEKCHIYASQLSQQLLSNDITPMANNPNLSSLTALQTYAYFVLHRMLPDSADIREIRSALTATYNRLYNNPSLFGEKGFLSESSTDVQTNQIKRSNSADCAYSTIFNLLPLGLPADDNFWSAQ